MNSPASRAAGAAIAIAVIFAAAARAQNAPAGDPGAPPPPQVRSQNGIEYINGGAGEETRRQIAAQSGDFPLRIVFSVASGAYAVADHVDVARGADPVLAVDSAGPLLVVKVPPGEYTINVTANGKSERRPIRVGTQPVTLNWRLAGDAAR
jgi:hypothetical protein